MRVKIISFTWSFFTFCLSIHIYIYICLSRGTVYSIQVKSLWFNTLAQTINIDTRWIGTGLANWVRAIHIKWEMEEEGFNWIFNGVIIFFFSSYFLRASRLLCVVVTFMHHQCKLTCLIGKLMLFLFASYANGKLIISLCVPQLLFILGLYCLSFLITIKKIFCRFLFWLCTCVTHTHEWTT